MVKKAKKTRKNKKLSGRKGLPIKAALVCRDSISLQFLSYRITDEPLKKSAIPEEIESEMENIFEQSKKSPGKIIERLKELIRKYPHVPQLYNYISVAYSNLGDNEKLKYYVEKNYQNNPGYLFAKLNYAEICMMEGDFDKVPEILENKFDIKALYPERELFHISEVAGFMGVAGLYFAHIGNTQQAELFCKGLEQLSPRHGHIKKIKRYLFMKSVKKVFKKMFGKRRKNPDNSRKPGTGGDADTLGQH